MIIAIGMEGTLEHVRARWQDLLTKHDVLMGGTPAGWIQQGVYTFLHLQYDTWSKEHRCHLARWLSEWILSHWERGYLQQALFVEHGYEFGSDQIERILSEAGTRLDKRWAEPRGSLLSRRLENLLEEHQELVLDGFLHFRCRDYLDELDEVLDEAVLEQLLDEAGLEQLEGTISFEADTYSWHLLPKRNGELLVIEFSQGVELHLNSIEGVIDVIGPNDEVLLHRSQQLTSIWLRMLREHFGSRMEHCEGCEVCQT